MTDVLEAHANQVAYWNNEGGARWVASQKRRGAMLGGFAQAALDKAQVQPGESVIDIGCGCGETSVMLAEAVGPGGKVLAADVSEPILAVAEEALSTYPNAEAVVADASTYPFEPAGADLLFSRFGVMFFGDPTAAFANLRKAIKPTGRLVFACWRTPKENVWMTGPLEAVFKHVERPAPPHPDDPGPFSFNSKERVTRILTEAGFDAPTFEPYDTAIDISVGGGVEGAMGTALEFGPASRLMAEQTDEVRQLAEASLRDYFATQLKDGAIALPAAVWIVSATPKA